MEFKEMKKEELIAKLEEQRHLASAVDSKDKEIASLKNIKDSEIASLSKKYAEIKDQTTKEKNELTVKISELEAKLKAVPSITRYEESIKKLEEENKRVIAFANQYINIFKNTLKALQGTLDNAIELQDMLVNTVKEK
jgi:hypothetical protein